MYVSVGGAREAPYHQKGTELLYFEKYRMFPPFQTKTSSIAVKVLHSLRQFNLEYLVTAENCLDQKSMTF